MGTDHTVTITITTEGEKITDLALVTSPGTHMLHGPAAMQVLGEKLIGLAAQQLHDGGYDGTLEHATRRVRRAVAVMAQGLEERSESETSNVTYHDTEEATDGR